MNRRLVISTLALFSVNVALAIGYCRIFAGWEWLAPMILVAAATQAVAAIGSRRPLPFVVAGAASTVVGVWVTLMVQLRSTLWFGFPTQRTLDAFESAISDSWAQVGDVVPPLPFHSGFGIAAMLSLVFAAIIGDAFVHRAAGRAEALIPSALVFIVVSAVGSDRLRVVSAALWITVALHSVTMLRRLDSHATRTPGFAARSAMLGLSISVASGLIAAYVAPLLPGAYDEAWLEQNRGGDQRIVDPMVEVRGRLFDAEDTVLFRVSAEVATYWRLTALPTFDGDTWGIAQSELDRAGGELAPVREPLDGDSVLTSYQSYEIEGLAGNLLPASFEPVQLRAATRSLFYALDPGALVVGGDGLRSTDAYEIVSKIPDPSFVNLMSAGVGRPPSTEYLDVPDTESMERIRRTALEVTAGAASPYMQAIAIQNWFRSEFEYSLDVPAGDGTDATLEFLSRRTGYCEQFSSTMALFARLLGIPSRVAIGFTPGELGTDGDYVVRSQHAHAWPELWFDNIGWVLFEPTPGRGAPNATYTGVEPQQDETPAVATTTLAPTSSTTTVVDETPTDQPTTTMTSVRPGAGTATRLPLWVLVALALVAWAVVMPSFVRRLAAHDDDPVLARWRRVLRVYAESGQRAAPHATPFEIAALFPPKAGLDEHLLADLAAQVTRRIYASETEFDPTLLARADTWLRDARRRLTTPRRIRLRLDPSYVWRMHR